MFLQQTGECLREERAFGLRLEKGFLVQRTYQLLPRPAGICREGCEQEWIKWQRRAEEEAGLEHWRRCMGRVTKGLLTMQGWLDFVLEM